MRKPASVNCPIQWRLSFVLRRDTKSKTDQASIRTRVMDVAGVRCMLGSDQLRRCNLNGRLRCRRRALLLTPAFALEPAHGAQSPRTGLKQPRSPLSGSKPPCTSFLHHPPLLLHPMPEWGGAHRSCARSEAARRPRPLSTTARGGPRASGRRPLPPASSRSCRPAQPA